MVKVECDQGCGRLINIPDDVASDDNFVGVTCCTCAMYLAERQRVAEDAELAMVTPEMIKAARRKAGKKSGKTKWTQKEAAFHLGIPPYKFSQAESKKYREEGVLPDPAIVDWVLNDMEIEPA